MGIDMMVPCDLNALSSSLGASTSKHSCGTTIRTLRCASIMLLTCVRCIYNLTSSLTIVICMWSKSFHIIIMAQDNQRCKICSPMILRLQDCLITDWLFGSHQWLMDKNTYVHGKKKEWLGVLGLSLHYKPLHSWYKGRTCFYLHRHI